MRKLILFILLIFISNSFAKELTGEFYISRKINRTETIWHSNYHYKLIESELEYPASGKEMYVGMKVSRGWFIDTNCLFFQKYNPGTGLDSDWSVSVLMYKARFTAKLKRREFNLRAGFELNKLKLFAIYTHSNFNYSMFSGEWLITPAMYGVWYGVKKIPGLKSSYDFEYQACGLGLAYVYDLVRGLYLAGSVDFFPYFEGNASAYWNLRNLAFKHEFRDVKIYSYLVGMGYQYKSFFIELCGFGKNLIGCGKNTKWVEDKKDSNPDISIDLKNNVIGTIFRTGIRLNLK